MGELFDLISGNFFIIIALAVGLLSFLKERSNKQEEEQEQRKTQQGGSTSVSPGSGNQQFQPAAANSNRSDNTDRQETVTSQQQSQREALAKRMRVDPDDLDKADETAYETKGELLKPERTHANKQQHQVKTHLKTQLTKNNLINGIVMSEVLGRPRALKPYKSVVEDRIKGK